MQFSNDQMEEAWSWIHNERRCVTTQTLTLSMGLSRSQASSLLTKLPTFKPSDKDNSYECVKCVRSEKDGKTVFQLQKSVISTSDMDIDDGNNTATMYSLALVETESVHTAHEKDMQQFRDLLKEEDTPQATATTRALEPTLYQDVIVQEKVDTARVTAYASQEARLSGRVVAASAPAQAATSKHSFKSSSAAAPRKATTAANFFASKPSSKSKKKPPPASKKVKTTETKKKPAKAIGDKKKSLPQDNDESQDDKVQAMDIDDEPQQASTTSSKEVVQEEKENSVNKKVGNADDFVGDEDEDDDFLEQERARKSRNAARDKKQAKKKQEQVAMNVDEEEPVEKVHGAMDAFAQHEEKKPASQPARKTKRRKRLVEKTTMDASGYLHTETQAVWEDVEEEEEEEPAPKPVVKKAPVKNTKNMKQGSLMGFFAAKKK